jgi:hypothetical protein
MAHDEKEHLEEPAGDEYLVWEPQGFSAKLSCWISNSSEALLFLFSALFSIRFNSFPAGIFCVISSGLLVTGSVKIENRNRLGQLVQFTQLIFLVLLVMYKFYRIDFEEDTTDGKLFRKQWRMLTSFGIYVKCTPEEKLSSGADCSDGCHTEVLPLYSFNLEIICFIITLYTMIRNRQR